MSVNQNPTRISIIKDPSLAPLGYNKLEWVRNNMPVLNMLRDELEQSKPLQGKIILCCLHLEAKTGYLF